MQVHLVSGMPARYAKNGGHADLPFFATNYCKTAFLSSALGLLVDRTPGTKTYTCTTNPEGVWARRTLACDESYTARHARPTGARKAGVLRRSRALAASATYPASSCVCVWADESLSPVDGIRSDAGRLGGHPLFDLHC